MSVIDVSKALQHVHNQLEVEKQWLRAIRGLAPMTHLQRAQVWADLSSHTLSIDTQRAPVVLSQYKALYKAALKAVDVLRKESEGGYDTSGTEVWDLLKEYRRVLEVFKAASLMTEEVLDEGSVRVARVSPGSSESIDSIRRAIDNEMATLKQSLTKTIEDLTESFLKKQEVLGNDVHEILLKIQTQTTEPLEANAGMADQLKECLDITKGLENKMAELTTKVEQSVATQTAQFADFEQRNALATGAPVNATQSDAELKFIKGELTRMSDILESVDLTKIQDKWDKREKRAMEDLAHIREHEKSAKNSATMAEQASKSAVAASENASRAAALATKSAEILLHKESEVAKKSKGP